MKNQTLAKLTQAALQGVLSGAIGSMYICPQTQATDDLCLDPRSAVISPHEPPIRASETSATLPAQGVKGPSATELKPKPFNDLLFKHLRYLKEVTGKYINLETATRARRAWKAIWEAGNYAMPVPGACTGPDGQMFYGWDHGRHHLELEIIPGQAEAEWFYRDRETELYWAEDWVIGDPLPLEAVEKLRLFV